MGELAPCFLQRSPSSRSTTLAGTTNFSLATQPAAQSSAGSVRISPEAYPTNKPLIPQPTLTVQSQTNQQDLPRIRLPVFLFSTIVPSRNLLSTAFTNF